LQENMCKTCNAFLSHFVAVLHNCLPQPLPAPSLTGRRLGHAHQIPPSCAHLSFSADVHTFLSYSVLLRNSLPKPLPVLSQCDKTDCCAALLPATPPCLLPRIG
jgi:hypothetical protein